jgi:hypothetical protein
MLALLQIKEGACEEALALLSSPPSVVVTACLWEGTAVSLVVSLLRCGWGMARRTEFPPDLLVRQVLVRAAHGAERMFHLTRAAEAALPRVAAIQDEGVEARIVQPLLAPAGLRRTERIRTQTDRYQSASALPRQVSIESFIMVLSHYPAYHPIILF